MSSFFFMLKIILKIIRPVYRKTIHEDNYIQSLIENVITLLILQNHSIKAKMEKNGTFK